jgi:hypothetical protein
MADNQFSLSIRLEELCEQILALNDYEIVSRSTEAGLAGLGQPDFTVLEPNRSKVVLVEVKLYRSPRVDTGVLRNAAAQLYRFKITKYPDAKTLFITTALLDEKGSRLLKNIGIDEAWDIQELVKKAATSAELSERLGHLLRDAGFGSVDMKSGFSSEIGEIEASTVGDAAQRGDQLVRQFETTTTGVKDAKRFEQLCVESIDYLFGMHLGRLKPQNRLEKGFQYMDLIARLEPKETGAFWLALAQDFRCRYVVFEFKNYAEEITQNQIYTTEKYLYPNALRSVAIIIARNGHDKGAGRAIQGALRESGKVFVVLSLNDLYDLLRAKDRGDEPSDMMVDHLDSLLTDIVP